MDPKPLAPVPPWVDLALTPVMVVACLFFAWLSVYRRDSMNRHWQAYGIQLSFTWARLMACMFLVGTAGNMVKLVGIVASRLP